MRIDVHAHYLNDAYLDKLDAMGGIEAGTDIGRMVTWPTLNADLEARFKVMEQAQVDLQILSVSGIAPYYEKRDPAVEGARYANDMYAELMREHPKKFSAFATLPLPHVEASLAEMTRAMDELHMPGITLTTSVLGKNLGDRSLDPVYAELDRRGGVLFIHPAGLACGSPQIAASGLLWPLGGTAEDTLCLIAMLQSGFTVRFPNIRTIMPHLGGTLPFLMHRLDRPVRRTLPDQTPLEVAARKFWYDTVNGYGPALQLAATCYGADRLLFGTDYPFFKDDAYKGAADYVLGSGLSASEIEGIFSGNAKRLFEGLLALVGMIFIALLRAVNVGGRGKVAMADLRALCEELGLNEARSLLQSGNLVFDSPGFNAPGKSAAQLETLLARETARKLGLETEYLVRSAAEWRELVKRNPFPGEAEADASHLLAVCLKTAPKAAEIKALQGAIKGRERVAAAGKQLYAVYPDGIGNSKLTMPLIESRLGARGTGRNWNTVLKLLALI